MTALAGTDDDHDPNPSTEEPTITFSVPLDFVEKGGVTRIVANGDAAALFEKPDRSLVKSIARAHSWKKQLLSGEVRSVKEIAREAGVTGRYVSRILRFAFLAPDITEAILEGRQPPSLSVERLREPIPYDWTEQRRMLGFRAP
jgi:hypothetical protein